MQRHIYHLSIQKIGAKEPQELQLEVTRPIPRASIVALFGLDGPTVEKYTIREEDTPLFYGHKNRINKSSN